jgi:hypothetical protein
VEGIRDTAAWKNLVHRVGNAEAVRVLRARLIMMDENAGKQSKHLTMGGNCTFIWTNA